MKQFILLVENENGEQILEGFFNTKSEAEDYLKEIDISFSDVRLYQLAENAYDLFKENGDTVKLKPCPFCGSENVANMNGWVQCFSCNASGPDNNNRFKAIDAWNKLFRNAGKCKRICRR